MPERNRATMILKDLLLHKDRGQLSLVLTRVLLQATIAMNSIGIEITANFPHKTHANTFLGAL